MLVPGDVAEALRATEQDVGCVGLREEEEHDEPDGPGEPEDLPQRPAPVLCRDGEAANHRTEGWAAGGGEGPQGENVGQLDEGEHVLEAGAPGCQTGGAEEALEEAKDQEARDVVDEGGGDAEEDEDGEGDHVGGVAADEREFREGAPEHGAHAVGEDVEGEAEGGDGGGDAVDLDDVVCGRGVD